MTFDEWYDRGLMSGWISRMFCVTHDGVPGTPDEYEAWNGGEDPCQFCVRIRDTDEPLHGGREAWGPTYGPTYPQQLTITIAHPEDDKENENGR